MNGLAYRTQVLVLAAECGFESRPWHLCPWARHLIIIASLHPGVKWVPVRAPVSWVPVGTCELVNWPRAYMRCNGSNWAVYSPGSSDGFRNDVWALWAGVIMRLEHHLVGGYVRYISPHIIIEYFHGAREIFLRLYLINIFLDLNRQQVNTTVRMLPSRKVCHIPGRRMGRTLTMLFGRWH